MTSSRGRLAAAFAVAALVGLLAACGHKGPIKSPVDPARMSQIVQVLASDAFEGRGPATDAEPKVIDYLTSQLAAMKLEPGGENGGWTQKVTLNRFQTAGPVALTLTLNGKPQVLTQGDQIVVQTLVPVDRVAIRNAPLVFVGYGVEAPERGWDDFKGVDLKGKIAVVLINDPDFQNPGSRRFGGKAMTYYGRWTYKYEEAARKGALGMLIVHETKPASYGWETVRNSNINAQFDIVRDDPLAAHPLLQGWIQHDLAVDLFQACGFDFEAMKGLAQSAGFHPVPLDCARFSANYAVDHDQVVTHNVLAKVRGRKRPNETVFYTAHWDHLGVGPPDAKGDTIYNGAVDNASGVAGVLELARAFAAGKQPDRTVVFMFTTAEEKGLLGATYYVSHPLYPLATTVADFNVDALDADGPAKDITVAGGGETSLEDDLAEAAKARGRYLAPDPDPGAGHFFRADHFAFAKAGVPAISIGSGRNLINGGRRAGNAWHEDYVAHRYHQPADQWSPDMDFSGEAQDLGVLYAMGRDLAFSDRWPTWRAHSAFKPARDATASERP